MPILPTDTTRTAAATTIISGGPVAVPDDAYGELADCQPRSGPPSYTSGDSKGQVEGNLFHPGGQFRLAFARTDVSFVEGFLRRLLQRGMTGFVGSPENILTKLNSSGDTFDIIVYPIWADWQRALDFSREVRRLRERRASPPYPRVLILSFVEQLPVTVQWFMRTGGTRYARFVSEENLVHVLWSMHNEILEAQQRSLRLHLRFIHAGNPNGVGCIRGEEVVRAYASFKAAKEDLLDESDSLLRFLSLLAMYRRSRSASELVRLMRESALYIPYGPRANLISAASVKTYVLRCESLLLRSWHRTVGDSAPPTLISREERGGREIGYRILATVEIDHI